VALVCPLYATAIDGDDPGVGERQNWDRDGEWFAYWIPWIADLRGGPTRLFHPACFAEDRGTQALIDVVTRWEKRRRAANG
jgi:hypothetical protein